MSTETGSASSMSSFLLGKGLLNRPGERLLHTQQAFKILAEYAVHYIGRVISNSR